MFHGTVADQHKIPSLTGYEPKSVETKATDTESIEPEDLEPRRIELERNLGTDPYQIQERFMRNARDGDMDEFGKVGAETPCLQSQMHFDYDSQRRALQTPDLEDGELRRMLASPLYMQSREDHESSRKANCAGETCCVVPGKRSKCKACSS